MRRIIIAVLFVFMCLGVIGYAQEVNLIKRTFVLLKTEEGHLMTDEEAKEIASFGDEVLPMVYDALFSRNIFEEGRWQDEALRVLAYARKDDSIPKIKAYLSQDLNMNHPFKALGTILEIKNTKETQKYVVETVNNWIAKTLNNHEGEFKRYDLDVEIGILRILYADVPNDDKVWILSQLDMSDFEIIHLYLPTGLSHEMELEYIQWIQKRFEVRKKKEEIVKRNADGKLQELAKRLNEEYFQGDLSWKTIRYSAEISKYIFGTCNRREREVVISYSLLELPEFVHDYVIIHELAHLEVQDHGYKFWKLVNRYPRTERARGYLMALEMHD